MQYGFDEIHALSALDCEPGNRQRFHMPKDLAVMGALVLLALMVLLVAALTLKVDKLVPGKGVFDTQLGAYQVRNMQAGYVKTVAVQIGETVKQGQVLAEFDDRPIGLEIDKARADMDVAARAMWSDTLLVMPQLDKKSGSVLLSKLNGIANPLEGTSIVSRLGRQVGTVQGVYASGRGTAAMRVDALRSQIEFQAQAVQLQGEELKQSELLEKAGFESAASLAIKRRLLLQAKANEKALSNELESVLGEAGRLSTEQVRQLNDLALDRLRRVDEALASYKRASLQLELLERQRDHLTLRAPFDATVDEVLLRGRQEYLAENTSMFSLRRLLSKEDLQINISLPAALAVWVRPGMPFRASAAGNNPEDHGFVRGVVAFVAGSTQPSDQPLAFRLKGRITEFDLKNGAARETFLRPGMELRVDVITGQRNLLSYLLDPIERTLREAATEPN